MACLALLTIVSPLVVAAQLEETSTTGTMSIQQYIAAIMEANYDIRQQRAQEAVARENVRREEGTLTPSLVVAYNQNREERQNTAEQVRNQLSSLFLSETESHSVGVEGMLPTGMQYRVSYVSRKLNNSLNNFDSEYVTFVGAELSQPLLKGAGSGATMARLHLARSEHAESYQHLRRRVMQTISQGVATYWDLVAAQERVRIRQDSERLAEKLVADVTEWEKVGRLTALDVAHARVGLGLRRDRLEKSLDEQVSAMNRARTLIGLNATPDAVLHASDVPGPVTQPEINTDTVMAAAVENHPEYLIRVHQLDTEAIRLKFARNQTWPELDLNATLGYNGLGDTASTSFDEIDRTSFETWTVGVQLRVPLGASPAKADLRAARHRHRAALTGLKAIENALVNAIDTVLNRVSSTARRVHHMQEIVQYNEQALAVERERLESGRSESRKVLEAEEELGTARTSYWEAVIAYQKALAELRFAEGTLLSHYQVAVEGEVE